MLCNYAFASKDGILFTVQYLYRYQKDADQRIPFCVCVPLMYNVMIMFG